MKKWLFNPFVYIAGAKALVIGLACMLATGVISFYSHVHFDGVVDIHPGRVSTLQVHLLEQLIIWAVPVVIFYLAGVIFSHSSIRIIDIAGTIAMSRWVMIFIAIIGFAMHVPSVMPKTLDDMRTLLTPSFIFFTVINLLAVIWMITLLYNAFVTSCNIKGGKATGIFIVSLLISEIIASLIIHPLLLPLF